MFQWRFDSPQNYGEKSSKGFSEQSWRTFLKDLGFSPVNHLKKMEILKFPFQKKFMRFFFLRFSGFCVLQRSSEKKLAKEFCFGDWPDISWGLENSVYEIPFSSLQKNWNSPWQAFSRASLESILLTKKFLHSFMTFETFGHA